MIPLRLSTSRPVRRSLFGRAASFAGALVFAASSLQAGPDTGPAARFVALSVEQGLSQGTVQVILQDHFGFLWFGTEEGLNRFDGYAFVVFRHDPKDPGSLPDDVVSALYEDRQGRLWIGTNRGLSLFDRRAGTFAPVSAVHRRVTSVLEEPAGRLWIGTDGEGLFERDPGTEAFVNHKHDPRNAGSLGSDHVSSLLRDRGGRLWIGLRDAGIDQLDGARTRFVHYRHDPRDPQSLAHDDVWSLAEDPAGRLWVATYGGGLDVLGHKARAFQHYRHRRGDPQGLRTDLLTCVFVDRSGTLWIGSDGAGLHRYEPGSDGFVAFADQASDPRVIRTIYQDVQNHLWVGSFMAGANILKTPRPAFAHFTHYPWIASSLSDPAVASFLEDRDGRIWVGTEGGRLNRFDRSTGTFVHHRPAIPGFPAILSLHQDRRGRIWLGTYRGGLARFDPDRGTLVRYRHEPGNPRSLSNDEVWVIAEDDEGSLWLGTNGELDRFDPELGVVVAHYNATDPEGRAHVGVRALHHDRDGSLWIGTLDGLHLLRRGGRDFVHYRHTSGDPRSLSHDMVGALHEDSHGRLWIGTLGGGLNRFDRETGAFTSYRSSHGLPSNVVYGIQEDSAGRLWLSTNRGLSRFDPSTERFENFARSNGVESLQFHLGASLKTRSGQVLLGSEDGFYDIDADAVNADTYAPPVVLTSFRVFNEPVKLPAAISTLDEISLTHRDKIFSLEFAAIDFTFPRSSRYAYKMEGLSDRWMQLGDRRDVTFTNLDPGTYVFRVKAANSDGVWNEKETSLRVLIRPPFWASLWFRALVTAAAVIGLLAAHRVRVYHLEERERELTVRVDEAVSRLRILKGLLPMCAWCKKVRDDGGYWSQVETYIREHSEADFSHGVCPECAQGYRAARGNPRPNGDEATAEA